MTDNELKNKVIERFFDKLNSEQRAAVLKIDGANLILAGAGSGKTATVCNRLTNMLLFGNAYYSSKEYNFTEGERKYLRGYIEGREALDIDKMYSLIADNPIDASNILTVTFTKKAANELKERIAKIGLSTKGLRVGTFHSVCNDILRKGIQLLEGYTNKYYISDTEDVKSYIKSIVKNGQEHQRLTPMLEATDYCSIITDLKNKMKTCFELRVEDLSDTYKHFYIDIRNVFIEYEKMMRQTNRLDFDDLLLCTVKLLKQEKGILEYWQHRWKYIMIDEYQDTNRVQYEFVKLITGEKPNIMVVGDENQSIYKFRGADITHILNFNTEFKATKYLLEQNYRSTSTILNAANALIKNNEQQMGKNLWTANVGGSSIDILEYIEDKEEVEKILARIQDLHRQGISYNDIVILARSRWVFTVYEKELARRGIPYEIVGKINFFERKEVKDILAYLQIIIDKNNYALLGRFKGVVEGFGNKACTDLCNICKEKDIDVLEALNNAEEYGLRSSKGYIKLKNILEELKTLIANDNKQDVIKGIVEKTGYLAYLGKVSKDSDEYMERESNLILLNDKWSDYLEDDHEVAELSDLLRDFIADLTIESEISKNNKEKETLKFMTVHMSKGLEFDTVFIVGFSDGLMPMMLPDSDIEEERRIGYVAVTRAKRKLYLVHSALRMRYGGTQGYKVSRFKKEMQL